MESLKISLALLLVLVSVPFRSGQIINRPNVLLLVLDDFRPAIKSFGDTKAITPNIDRIVNNGYYFTNAFAQQSICAPSRNSFLTGRRPDTTKLYDFYSYWRESAGNFTTLPQYFKQNGYLTKSIGKVFHPGVSSNFTDDYPLSWTDEPYHPSTAEYMNEPTCIDMATGNMTNDLLCPVVLPLQPEGTLPDIQSTEEAKNFLKSHRNSSSPYFLAVGYYKPHIPFKIPMEYLKLHENTNFKTLDLNYPPYGLPTVAWNSYLDIRSRDDMMALNISYPFGPIPELVKLKIRQHYYAAVTYIDTLIGELLKDVNFENTIIVITSDHGWALGEHAEWSKYSNYDVALNVPLVVYNPEVKPRSENKIETVVELLDLFPTLVDLAGLPPIPTCKTNRIVEETCVEGKSLQPLIYGDPCDSLLEEAFSQYPRPGTYPSIHPNSDKPKLYQIEIMGYSLRTKQYRYTAWIAFDPNNFTRDWSEIYGEELYDHTIDPKENMNIVDRSHLAPVVEWLRLRLQEKFCGI